MKMLLQNPVTHLFLKALGEWTLDPDQARDFKDITEAVEFQIQHHLTEAQLFLKLERWEPHSPSATIEGEFGEEI